MEYRKPMLADILNYVAYIIGFILHIFAAPTCSSFDIILRFAL